MHMHTDTMSKNKREETEEAAGVNEVTYLKFQLIQNVFMVEVCRTRANVSHTQVRYAGTATMYLLAKIYIQM